MSGKANDLPNPTPAAVSLWLKQISREQLHDEAWQEVNRYLHGITRAARPFIQRHYTFEEQEAVYDGLALGLKTLMHFTDIEQLAKLLAQGPTSELSTSATTLGEGTPSQTHRDS